MTDADDLDRAQRWAEVLDDSTYYEILGVLEIADDAAIREAFHSFAQAFHPDSHTDADEELLATVRRLFQRGAEAYRVLSHPELRVRYDMALDKGELRLQAGNIPQRPRMHVAAKPLDELCRSGGAKLCAKKADKLISAGDLAGAKRELEKALQFDGGANPALAERLDALEVALYAMGGG